MGEPGGLEFSPDGSKIYISTGTFSSYVPQLYQFNLCAGNEQAVNSSKYIVYFDSTVAAGGQLQLASNGKIYKSRYQSTTVGVVNNPNLSGAACNYNNVGPSVATGTSSLTWGMPNFITSDMNVTALTQFSYAVSCQNVNFTNAPGVSDYCGASSYWPNAVNWNFGEPSSGAANTSTVTNPMHTYSNLGTFTTQLILTFPCRTDTFRQAITISTLNPNFTVSGKTTICKSEFSILTATTSSNQGAMTYTWSSTVVPGMSVSVSPTVTTIYTVTGKNATGCSATKTIQVTVNPCTAIEEELSGNLINIHPNPTSGIFTLESTKENGSYKIHDQSGRLVQSGAFKEKQIVVDLKNYANGIYFVEIKNGDIIIVKKLVKTE